MTDESPVESMKEEETGAAPGEVGGLEDEAADAHAGHRITPEEVEPRRISCGASWTCWTICSG